MPGAGHGLDLDEHVPRRLRAEGSNKDVFCMVNAKMSDAFLSQRPVLVFPQSFLGVTEAFFNKVNSCTVLSTASLEDSRCEELQEMAECIEKDFPHMSRGVSYLRSLTDPDRRREPCPRLKFIDAGPSLSWAHGLGDLRLGPGLPPPKPYPLQVVFHHRQNR